MRMLAYFSRALARIKGGNVPVDPFAQDALPCPASAPQPQDLDDAQDVLKRRVDELERHVASLQDELSHPRELAPQSLRENARAVGLVVATCLLAALPSVLVARDRWLGKRSIFRSLEELWCKSAFLCDSGLPPYFILIFPCFLCLLILVWRNKARPLVAFSNLGLGSAPAPAPHIPAAQSLVSRVLLTIAAVGSAAVVLGALLLHRIPGWDLALILVAYVLGWVLREIPIDSLAEAWRSKRGLVLAALLTHLALIAWLANRFSTTEKPRWIFGLLLGLATLNLLRYRQRVRPIFWIVSLALILFTWDIDAWWFSCVGDEYSFFHVARRIAEEQSLPFILSRLFGGQEVYGSHPYFSSLIQAGFMKVLGSDNFGWRFSSVYVAAISIGFFFLFFKTLVPRQTALMASLFLAASHYLMSFGKIGYNNLQALLAMSVALWASAWALCSMRPLAFVTVGLALGLCFYVYPAALYVVPLPLLLLLLHHPPKSRLALRHWVTLTVSMLLLVFPLFLQPGYWETKGPGTFFANPEVMASNANILRHFASNLVYAFVSFVYILRESHFVAASCVDPLSGGLVALGMMYLVVQIRKSRSALFLIIGFAVLLVLVGASHYVPYPPMTRLFLLLPWFALFAAIGLTWIQQQIRDLMRNRMLVAGFSALFMSAVIALNLYQAYPFSRQRMDRYQTLEPLLLRTAKHAQDLEPGSPKTFVFITDLSWSIDGIRDNTQSVYSIPPSPLQLVRTKVSDSNLPESDRPLISAPESLVIIQPWLDAEWKSGLEAALRELGKVPCDIKTSNGTVRFQLWHSEGLSWLCQ